MSPTNFPTYEFSTCEFPAYKFPTYELPGILKVNYNGYGSIELHNVMGVGRFWRCRYLLAITSFFLLKTEVRKPLCTSPAIGIISLPTCII